MVKWWLMVDGDDSWLTVVRMAFGISWIHQDYPSTNHQFGYPLTRNEPSSNQELTIAHYLAIIQWPLSMQKATISIHVLTINQTTLWTSQANHSVTTINHPRFHIKWPSMFFTSHYYNHQLSTIITINQLSMNHQFTFKHFKHHINQ